SPARAGRSPSSCGARASPSESSRSPMLRNHTPTVAPAPGAPTEEAARMTSNAAAATADGRRALSIGLVLTVSIAAFEALAVATVLPETVREIGGLAWYGWAFTGFLLANLAGIPLAGEAADRRGPAPPYVAGVLLFGVGLGVAGSAHSMLVLVAGRVLQGAGAAALSAVSYVAVARAYPADAQPRMMAMLSSAWVIPGLFGPALAAAVARSAGWRFVFLGLVPATLLAGSL